jgi:hypothetical protein
MPITDAELNNWVLIPIEHIPLAKVDPYHFLRNVLNIATESIEPFFRNRTIINSVFDIKRHNPFNEKRFALEDWWNVQDNFNRYIHIDLAVSRDRAGIACCHTPGFVGAQRSLSDGTVFTLEAPIIVFDYIGIISASEKEEIDINKFFDIVLETNERGAFTNLITFDKFQSQSLIMLLRNEGYTAGVLSIDRTTTKLVVDPEAKFGYRKETTDGDYSSAMMALRLAMLDGRIKMSYHSLWEEECNGLEWIEKTGKVEKAVGSTDDLVQSVAGAVFNLENNEIPLIPIMESAEGTKKNLIKVHNVLQESQDEKENFSRNVRQELNNFIQEYQRDERKEHGRY